MIKITDEHGVETGSVSAIGTVTTGTLCVAGSNPTPPVIIGPAPALPWLRQFYAGGGFLPIHASNSPVAWTFIVDQSVGTLDVTIDGSLQLSGNSSKHTWIFTSGSTAGYFSWVPTQGTHAFVLTFYDVNGAKIATVPQSIPVVP